MRFGEILQGVGLLLHQLPQVKAGAAPEAAAPGACHPEVSNFMSDTVLEYCGILWNCSRENVVMICREIFVLEDLAAHRHLPAGFMRL